MADGISHLVENGKIVIYPRYQKNIIFPSSSRFTPNVAFAIKKALNELQAKEIINRDFQLFLAGHSFGGVISANLAAEYEKYEIPKPSGVMVCEGGVGPFTKVILEDYSSIEEDIPVFIVAGANDWTVGDKFGRKLFSDLTNDHVSDICTSKFILQRTYHHYFFSL